MKTSMRHRRRFATTRQSAIRHAVARALAAYWADWEPSDNPRAYMGEDGWLRYY